MHTYKFHIALDTAQAERYFGEVVLLAPSMREAKQAMRHAGVKWTECFRLD